LILFFISSFYKSLINIVLFLYPFIFMLSILMTLLFYCTEYFYEKNVFNCKISKNLLIDECICHLVHFLSTSLIILVLFKFIKKYNLTFKSGSNLYLLVTIFCIYYNLKLCSPFKNHENWNYNSLNNIFKDYGQKGLNLYMIFSYLLSILLTYIGSLLIN
jgi:hypothetical protein